MPVSVIFGGQFGSEGKGKATLFFAKHKNAKAVIRVGGPNSGHTVINDKGDALVFKNLPVSAILPNVYSVISSGSYINVEILLKEIEFSEIHESNLLIDPFAVIISEKDIENESKSGLKENIGSTGSGTGSALSRRINRDPHINFAKDDKRISKYIKPTKPFLRELLKRNERVLIEGTQGFGLSLLHSDLYPFTTSRDCGAAGFVSEAGLSPLDVDDIIMVLRAFPIRVGGNSGPLPKETNWEQVTLHSGSSEPLVELTSVTKKVRRVAEFDLDVVRRSLEVNMPTTIVLNHVDYFDKKCREENLSAHALDTVKQIENNLGVSIDFVGTDRISLYPFTKSQKKTFRPNLTAELS